ncbi:MAG: LamB/YcsF family protein, partial [Planctomycetes bacterium]|nr:LamB/YcsF family protein [Planctomycetota bacterium]
MAKNACSGSLKLANGASCLVNINCDLGEGLANDAELMPYLHSCNIACGAHAGDQQSIRETVKLAIAHGVKIGAHPSFDDRQNFGRVAVEVSRENLTASLVRQINWVRDECKAQGAKLHHVKPHGALYNLMCEDKSLQGAVEDAICKVDAKLPLYAPPFFTSTKLKVIGEGFADRAYTADGRLRPRGEEGALIEDENIALAQTQKLQCDTVCVHGDNPAAIAIVKHLTQRAIEIVSYGADAWLINWSQKIHPDILWAVLAAKNALEEKLNVRCVHAYCSLLVFHHDKDEVAQVVAESKINAIAGKLHEVHVNYQADAFAQQVHLDADQVVELHTAPEYLIYFLGFLPGFPYLGGLDPRLNLPRLAQPKQNIPAG